MKEISFSEIISTKKHRKTTTATEVFKPPSPIEIPSKENIYIILIDFFRDLMRDHSKRFDIWEASVSNILAILRKMQKVTRKNSEDLISSINNLFEKIRTSLNQFKIKSNEVEKVAGIDLLTIYDEYNKVLGLLKLHIKELHFKNLIDELIQEQKLIL